MKSPILSEKNNPLGFLYKNKHFMFNSRSSSVGPIFASNGTKR